MNSKISMLIFQVSARILTGFVAVVFFGALGAGVLQTSASSAQAAAPQTESYKNLIEKARNLALQQDRLQASQLLQRGLKNESKSSTGYKEMLKTLENLMNLFLTEKAQSLFSQAEAVQPTNPRAAIETYQAALRAEDGNVSVLKALARTHLILSECDKADVFTKQAENMNPFSNEVKLLRLQVLDCQGNSEQVSTSFSLQESELTPLGSFVKAFVIKDALRRKDVKKAKAALASWEQAASDYPEVFYWKHRLAQESNSSDRAATAKYVQLCESLTPRKRKTYAYDVDLCRHKDKLEESLKESAQETPAPGVADE